MILCIPIALLNVGVLVFFSVAVVFNNCSAPEQSFSDAVRSEFFATRDEVKV